MEGSREVEKYMGAVADALGRHLEKGPAWTDIYNRAYEAVSKAISDRTTVNADALSIGSRFRG